MEALQIFSEGSWEIRTKVHHETPYFCGKDVAKSLGYVNPRQAVIHNTFEEDRVKLQDIQGSTTQTLVRNEGASVYVTEPGVYGLIFGSEKEKARAFKKWVCQHVLPRLRKAYQEQCQAPLCLQNENALHFKVVQAIRRFYPQAVLVAGLGEMQDSADKRIEAWKKGYTAGQPDLLLLNHHAKWNGFAIELKNPKGTGRLSAKQADCLETYKMAKFKTLVSDDYDTILLDIFEYMQNTRLQCPLCCKKFKTLVSDDYDTILLDIFEYMQNTRLQCQLCCKKFKTDKTLRSHVCGFHKCC